MSTRPVNMVVALHQEAAPLIKHFELKGLKEFNPFRIYTNGQVNLVISGSGQNNCAAAVGCLFAATGAARNSIWLNIGIAGSGSLSIGQVITGNKVTSATTGRSFYPQHIGHTTISRDSVYTVDKPEKEFTNPGVYDMEASAFIEQAMKLSTAEFVHTIKVVSDTPEEGFHQLKKEDLQDFIQQAIPSTEEMIRALSDLAKESAVSRVDESILHAFQEKWHFTETRKHQLLDLLRRYAALWPEADVSVLVADCKDAKEVLKALELRIDQSTLKI